MNVKINLKVVFFSSMLLCLTVLNSCEGDDGFAIENPKTLEFQFFSLVVPEDWNGFTQQGIDTYIGGLTNQVDTLYFDYGLFSFGSLDDIQENSETLSFQALNINGVNAKIVKEKREQESEIRYSVYLDKRDDINLNRVYGYGLAHEDLIKAIFLSHKFTN